jgi:serine/threonine protein phosphatase PrpC
MSTNTLIYLAAKTDMGRVRKLNEDKFLVPEWIRGIEGSIMAVADGMGGTNAGEVASAIAIGGIKEYFVKKDTAGTNDEEILYGMKQAIFFAHCAILKKARTDASLKGMGTTLIIGWVLNGKFFTAWSGDSRCYYYRRPTGLRQLSKDHSFVQTLVDAGEITAEQAFFHPRRHIITQGLGDAEHPPVPDTGILTLLEGDILLLCSDGLSGMLTDKQIEKIIQGNEENMNQCADQLIDQANEAGGGDNITVILSKVVN